jgi:hypothetical protein
METSLGAGAFDLERALSIDPGFLVEDPARGHPPVGSRADGPLPDALARAGPRGSPWQLRG